MVSSTAYSLISQYLNMQMLRKDQLVVPEGPFIEVQRAGRPLADLCTFDQQHAWWGRTGCENSRLQRPWAHAAQRSMKVLKAPRLPSKSSLRCWKRHACHVKCSGINPTQFVAELPRTSMKVLKAPRLPRKSSLKCWKFVFFLHPLLFTTAKRHGGACAWPSQLTVHSINRLHCGSLRYTADASSIISDQCEKSEDHQPVGHSRHMPDRSKREICISPWCNPFHLTMKLRSSDLVAQA